MWKRWVAFWSSKEPGTALAVFRMLVSATVLYTVLGVVQAGVVEVAWINEGGGGYQSRGEPWVLALLGGATPTVVWGLVIATLGAALFLLVGFGGRWPALVALQTFLAITDANPDAGGSYDLLLANAMLLLFFSPCTQTLSVDCWRRTGRLVDTTPVSAVIRYLAVYQLLLMYWTSGLQKLSAHWVPGGDSMALYYIVQQPSWQRANMEWMASWVWVTQMATAFTWLWEVLSPLWLVAFWFELTRERPGRVRALFNSLRVGRVYAAIGILFHVSVTVLLNVGPFSWSSLAFYPCLLHPEDWARMGRRLTGLRGPAPGQRDR